MSSFSDRLLETILKDIDELKNFKGSLDNKSIRKECNLLKSRLQSLSKLNLIDEKKIQEITNDLESILT